MNVQSFAPKGCQAFRNSWGPEDLSLPLKGGSGGWNMRTKTPAPDRPPEALRRSSGSFISGEKDKGSGSSLPGLHRGSCCAPTQPKLQHYLSRVNTHPHTQHLPQKWPKLREVHMSLEMISFACFKSALVCTACSSKFTLQKADSFFHILFT